MICAKRTEGSKSFWTHLMELEGDVGYVESRFSPFGDWLVSVKDSCTIEAKCTVGSESFWTDPTVLLGDEAQADARFGPVGDSANLDAR
jgi:hypothetical protein